MKRFKLNNKGNSQLVAVLISIPVLLLFLCATIGAFAYSNTYNRLDDFADEMIAKAGKIGKCSGTAIDTRYDELQDATKLSPTVEFSATYFDSAKKTVQYGDTITLTLTLNMKIFEFYDFYVPKTLIRVKTTQSEQYWK